MQKTCQKCGGPIEAGFTTALGLIGGSGLEGQDAQLIFVVEGERTAANPVRAFQQGVAGVPHNRAYTIRGLRCARCGTLELYADKAYAG
jgi:hypothetical protein